MVSIFSALEDRLSAAIDVHFGETFVFMPMTQVTVNSRRSSDPERLSFEFTATFDDGSAGSNSFERLGNSSGGKTSGSGKPSFSVSSPMLFFEGTKFSSGLPRRLDRVLRVDTGAVYEILDRGQDGQGRHKAALTKVAQE